MRGDLRSEPRRRTPEQERIRAALQVLTATPEWDVFVTFSAGKIEDVSIDPAAPNMGALLRLEGRRTFHRELIERLRDRVNDERSANSGGD